MKYLIFSDIDGTIYGKNFAINELTLQDIKKAQALGVEFIIATGNGHFQQVNDVAAKSNANYVISSNGAGVFDVSQQKFIFEEMIPQALAQNILDFASKHNIAGDWWDKENVYVSKNQSDSVISLIKKALNPINGVIKSEKINNDIFKIEFYGTVEEIDLIEGFVNGMNLQVARMKPTHVEITHVGVSKGSGVNFMIKLLNSHKDKTMSIGDSANDLPMFRETKHSYAMDNGSDLAHEVANHHTSDVLQNGLGRAIEDFIYREKIG